MSASCVKNRGRFRLPTAIFVILSLCILLLLAACGGTAPAIAEPTAVPTSPLPADTAVPPTEASAPSSPLAEKMDAWIKNVEEPNGFMGAMLVSHGDEIILSQGYGMADIPNKIPNTPATKFRIASLSRPFTALAIMQLQEQGLLDVNDPICSFLDGCPATWKEITIHHLLTHSSGIQNYRDVPGYNTIMFTPMPPDQLLAQVKDMPLGFAPGQDWQFSDSDYVILGQIIERVSGQSYADFLQENIFDPLDMASTGLEQAPEGLALGYTDISHKPATPLEMSHLFAFGGIYSTVEDLNRWARALFTEQLVSKPVLDLMFTGQPCDLDIAYMMTEDMRSLCSYGYGWLITSVGDHDNIMHPGLDFGVSSVLGYYPKDDLMVIVLSNQDTQLPWRLNAKLANMVFAEK